MGAANTLRATGLRDLKIKWFIDKIIKVHLFEYKLHINNETRLLCQIFVDNVWLLFWPEAMVKSALRGYLMDWNRGLLWCFYQLFELSFWRHPFTADDLLVSKWCKATFLQICSDEETNSSTSWMAWGWVNFWHIFNFGWTIPISIISLFLKLFLKYIFICIYFGKQPCNKRDRVSRLNDSIST